MSHVTVEPRALHLLQHVQGDGVEHVVDDDAQHRAGGCSQSLLHVRAGRAARLDGRHGLEHRLGPLGKGGGVGGACTLFTACVHTMPPTETTPPT